MLESPKVLANRINNANYNETFFGWTFESLRPRDPVCNIPPASNLAMLEARNRKHCTQRTRIVVNALLHITHEEGMPVLNLWHAVMESANNSGETGSIGQDVKISAKDSLGPSTAV